MIKLFYLVPQGDRRYEIVSAPPCTLSPLVDAHYRAFRDDLEKLSPSYWTDKTCWERFQCDYRRIAHLVCPDLVVEALTPQDRHSFFVSRGAGRLSHLELLLGYSEADPGAEEPLGVEILTTGQPHLDVIAELYLLGLPDIPWLVDTYSVTDLLVMSRHLWDRKLGRSGQVSQAQKDADYALFEGLVAQGVVSEARAQAKAELLFTTGLGAIATNAHRQGISAEDSQPSPPSHDRRQSRRHSGRWVYRPE